MRSIFEISKSGMNSARTATEIASNNIANAHTPGYTRRRALLTEEVQRLSYGVLGRGVTAEGIQRVRNEQIDRQIIGKEHEIGEYSERANLYRLMETRLISTPDAGLDAIINDFFDAFSELSGNPQDLNLRNVLISKAGVMTAAFRELDKDLNALGNLALDQAYVKLNRVNELLQDLGALNADIAGTSAKKLGNDPALDEQGRVLKELASIVEFDSMVNPDGTMEIRIGGVPAVSGQNVAVLQSEVDELTHSFRIRLPGGKLVEPGAGGLAANIHMFEQGIPDSRKSLSIIAGSLMEEINRIHSNGYGLQDDMQRTFFDPGSTDAATMRLNSAILDNPHHIAASDTEGEPGNNQQALEIVNLREMRLLDGQTLLTKAVEFMGHAGLKLNEVDQKMQSGIATRDFLVNRQEQLAGVNIDEELGNLIRFQNSYQASARVLETGRQMFDTLLSIA